MLVGIFSTKYHFSIYI